jgi:ABC-type polysaccharide/polyol phosphate export permease
MSTQQEAIGTIDLDAPIAVTPTDQAAIDFPRTSPKESALLDLTIGLKKWRIWLMLAYQDIKLRYRRSVLGPLWLTLSMAITAYSMGFLYGHLFRTNLEQYYPFLVAGMLTWGLISTAVTDLTDTFVLSDGLIKQIKLPYSLYIHRVISRNIIIFFHNSLVMLPIYILFSAGAKINFYSLLIIPGLFIFYINALLYGIVLAMIGSRFRDVSQIIKSLIQVVFFMTPVMWSPIILAEPHRYLVYFNPFYSYIEMIRAPILGTAPNLLNLAIVLGGTIIGALLSARIFVPYRARIIYWL